MRTPPGNVVGGGVEVGRKHDDATRQVDQTN